MPRRYLQDIWGTFEENSSHRPMHHLWHLTALWFHGPVVRPQLSCATEEFRNLRPSQQGMAEGEDLSYVTETSRKISHQILFHINHPWIHCCPAQVGVMCLVIPDPTAVLFDFVQQPEYISDIGWLSCTPALCLVRSISFSFFLTRLLINIFQKFIKSSHSEYACSYCSGFCGFWRQHLIVNEKTSSFFFSQYFTLTNFGL